MTARGSITTWFTNNKKTILGVVVWALVAAIGGFATAIIPPVPADSRLIDLAIAGTVILNVIVIYLAFVGAARLVFKPSEGFIGSLKFAFRKDMMTTVSGILLFAVILISIPALATQGAWHIPVGAVAAVAFLFSWIIISFSMTRIYSIQFFEEVLTPKEKIEYETKLNSKAKKPTKDGMFLVDLSNTVRSRLNRITGIERARTHKLIFPYLQALFVLLAPTLLLFWTLWVLSLSAYTMLTAIAAPAIMALAAGTWAAWHVRGGFTRVVARRKGRVMESVNS